MKDVRSVLAECGIRFVEYGNNVARGNINIQCPFCGDSDPSEHLGINEASGMWGCWRNDSHRGRKLYRLIAKVLGISNREARRLTGEDGSRKALDEGDFDRAVEQLRQPRREKSACGRVGSLVMPKTMRELTDGARAARPYLAYLADRLGCSRSRAVRVASRYDLRYCVNGEYAGRIVIPVYKDAKLVTYVGRSIKKSVGLRYKAQPKKSAIRHIKQCLLGYDGAMKGGRFLFIVEGPMDWLKFDLYSRRKDCRAVALSSMSMEPEQQKLIANLLPKFDGGGIILLDRDQELAALRLEYQICHVGKVTSGRVPSEFEDPGDMDRRAIREMCDRYLSSM